MLYVVRSAEGLFAAVLPATCRRIAKQFGLERERHIADLTLLQEVGKSISTRQSLPEILAYVADEIGKVVAYSAGIVALESHTSGFLEAVSVWGEIARDNEGMQIPVEQSIMGGVYTSHEPVIVDDVPMGVTPDEAASFIRLVMIANDTSLRNLIPSELAKQFGFSTRYIQRLFSEEDCTVSRYIRRQRLEGCKKQLADPAWLNHSITEIAFNWGFNSSAHFSRVFKEEYGINAREYRKQALKGMSYYKDTGSFQAPGLGVSADRTSQ